MVESLYVHSSLYRKLDHKRKETEVILKSSFILKKKQNYIISGWRKTNMIAVLGKRI